MTFSPEAPIFPANQTGSNTTHIYDMVVVSTACGTGIACVSQDEGDGGSAFVLGEIFSPGQIRLTPFRLRLELVGPSQGQRR
jgi:hypothetical protein